MSSGLARVGGVQGPLLLGTALLLPSLLPAALLVPSRIGKPPNSRDPFGDCSGLIERLRHLEQHIPRNGQVETSHKTIHEVSIVQLLRDSLDTLLKFGRV